MNSSFREILRQQWHSLFYRKRYWFHIIAWFCIIVVSLIQIDSTLEDLNLNYMKIGEHEPLGKYLGSTQQLLHSVLGILLSLIGAATVTYFYLIIVVSFAKYKKKARYLWIGLLINAFIYLGFIFIINIIFGVSLFSDSEQYIPRIITSTFVSSFTSTIATYFFALYYFLNLYDQQKDLNQFTEVFNARIASENNFLKQQINPHFLFNTLNNIYSLALSQPIQAFQTIESLEKLMQYMLNQDNKELVYLEEEISFLENYLQLESLRNQSENVSIKFNVHGRSDDLIIAPLLLVNFVENAFKHGVKSTIDKSYIHIDIHIKGGVVNLKIENSKPPKTNINQSLNTQGGIGLKNTKRRLELLYHGAYDLKIENHTNTFTVHLKLKLL